MPAQPQTKPYTDAEVNAAIAATIAEMESKYCDLMEAVKRSRLPHGDCKSGERYGGKPLACAACMANMKIDELISNYKGRRIVTA